jgi:hypothetical protein
MAEIVNLRMARKAKARTEAERQAGENRVKFGRTKAEKAIGKAENSRATRALEAGRLETTKCIQTTGCMTPSSDPQAMPEKE